MRESKIQSTAGMLVFIVTIPAAGCDKSSRNDPARNAKVQAEVKREQAACGSASASDRLKNAIFDEAIAKRNGDRANLDVLADYSVARLQDPVVTGWDRSLDITRCNGRFILEVPPGAERGMAGEHQLEADIQYTAQASADGAGFVYHQKGAQSIVAKLAAFNLATQAYRPPPAIDQGQPPTNLAQESAIADQSATSTASSTPGERASAAVAQRPMRSAARTQASAEQVADRTSSEARPPAVISRRSGDSEMTVRAFYGALTSGNGPAASSQVIPEKRSSGAFSPGAISRFYGRLPEPLELTGIVPLAPGVYRVAYHYSAGRSRCNGSAVVRTTKRGGRSLIRSIQALTGC